jgi:hypothetical protein
MDPVKNLIDSLAKEMGLRSIDVERAYKAPFELQSIVMRYRCDREKQIFPSLRIPYFLIFYCPERRQQRLKKLQDKHKKDNETCGFDK